jgi:hypothetical protein
MRPRRAGVRVRREVGGSVGASVGAGVVVGEEVSVGIDFEVVGFLWVVVCV